MKVWHKSTVTPVQEISRTDPQREQVPAAAMPRRAYVWWVPDISLVMALVTLFYCLFLFDGWRKLFRDSDTGWHIRTGETILAARALPVTDPYSFTRAGDRWLDWEWGADVLTGAAHRAAGPAGVAVLFAVAIAACTWLWFRLSFAAGGDLLLACLMAAPMLSTVNLHWLARPHIFGWVLLLVFLLELERTRGRRFSVGYAALLFAIGVIWANAHGSFILAPVIAALFAAGERARSLVWETPPLDRGWWKACLAVTLGTLVNPFGPALHWHVIRYLSDAALLARIGEFQTFNFHSEGAGQILLMLGIATLGAAAALSERRLEHFLLALFLLAVALRSARGLPIAALAVLPFANAALTAALLRARGLQPALRRRLHAFFDYSERLRVLDRGFSGVALVPVVLAVLYLVTRAPALAAHAGFPADEFPVQAAAAVAPLPGNARILAPDKFGGYLIYRFSGARKVYFDGRSDFYGAQFMKDYIHLLEVRPGWREQVRSLGFTHALLPLNYSLVSALQQAGWRTVYKDATATLLAAPGH